ncbi:MAG: hypothetical protein JXR18_14140 [Neptuniibacter sp.]
MSTEMLERIVPIFISFCLALVFTYFFVDSIHENILIEKCFLTHGPDAQVCVVLAENIFD